MEKWFVISVLLALLTAAVFLRWIRQRRHLNGSEVTPSDSPIGLADTNVALPAMVRPLGFNPFLHLSFREVMNPEKASQKAKEAFLVAYGPLLLGRAADVSLLSGTVIDVVQRNGQVILEFSARTKALLNSENARFMSETLRGIAVDAKTGKVIEHARAVDSVYSCPDLGSL